ncbi:hypothetical protein [Thalassiella azotivora]
MSGDQTPEEIRAQAAEGSAADFAVTWLQAAGEAASFEWIMLRSTEDLRFRHATHWVDQACPPEQRDDAIRALAEMDARSEWWRPFADANLRWLRGLIGYPDVEPGVGLRPRVADPGHEWVLIVDYGGLPAREADLGGTTGKYVDSSSARTLLTLLLGHEGGEWRIADYQLPPEAPATDAGDRPNG